MALSKEEREDDLRITLLLELSFLNHLLKAEQTTNLSVIKSIFGVSLTYMDSGSYFPPLYYTVNLILMKLL